MAATEQTTETPNAMMLGTGASKKSIWMNPPPMTNVPPMIVSTTAAVPSEAIRSSDSMAPVTERV